MFELLKKLGIPAAVAAVVALLVTIVPLIFKFDSRYAKEDDVNGHLAELTRQVNDLTVEVGQMVGTQQVLVTLIASQSKVSIAPVPVAQMQVPAPKTREVDEQPLPAPKNSQEMHDQILMLMDRIERTQQRVQAIQQHQ